MMTDPIADLLNRVMNGYRARLPRVNVPHSMLKEQVCGILRDEGFVKGVEVETISLRKTLVVGLAYDGQQRPAMMGVRRISKPGRRVYSRSGALHKVRNGLGISILTTSRGIVADEDARQRKIGGEVLCEVW